MRDNEPHPATPMSVADFLIKRGNRRGSYSCGRCGLPKKGHKCPFNQDNEGVSTPDGDGGGDPTSYGALGNQTHTLPQMVLLASKRRRALFFNDIGVADQELEKESIEPEMDLESGKFPANCLWEILRKFPPAGLLSAARVCRGWREITRKLWLATEELRLRVPAKTPLGYVGSMLHKCPGLVKLSVGMESDIDATMLACIGFSSPNLQSLEIFTSDSSVNWISGYELSHFIAEKRCLISLKMEGCRNLGGFTFSSTSLSTIWLSDLHSHSKMIFDCPDLKEISLDFSRQENDSTDLITVLDALGRSCPKLQNIHIASVRLSHAAVLALSASNLRGLRMLSLVLGSELTDASVAAIASSFSKLELLDLSGSSISDSGIGMICNVFPQTLSKLLVALCPSITSSGIQFAAAQLPLLELMDCGMTICDPNSENSTDEQNNNRELQKTPNSKLHLMYQKLIIKHSRLKKLSLWGCSGLDALHLNCPHLNDLNLNSCRNLCPEKLLLQCPSLESVHASDCQDMLVKALETQVYSDHLAVENHLSYRHLPDGSKRVQLPYFYSPKPSEDKKKLRRAANRRCTVIVTS